MRIISLHINNYGKLSNFDYNFDDHINTFCEDNGYGKSTIVSFIKAMFYGLETIKSNTSKFNDRKHFYPFSGRIFGGNITFEYKNKVYRIERTFDKKSEVKDELIVYVNDNKTTELGDVPGLKVFGINRESFEKIIAINAEKITIETDSDINKKLNNYVENVSEDFDIDVVIKNIKETKRINKTEHDDLKDDIRSLEDDVRNLEIIKESLESKYQDLNTLDKDKIDAKSLFDNVSALSIELEKWKSFDLLTSDINQKEEERNEILKKYPNGIPKKEEIINVKELDTKIRTKEHSLQESTIANDDLNEYQVLLNKYKNYHPTDQEILRIDDDIIKFNSINSEIKTLENEEKSFKEKELDKHFFGELPTDIAIINIENEFETYAKMEEEQKKLRSTITISENQIEEVKKTVNKSLYIGLLVLSLVLIGLGIGLIFSVKILGIILLVLGAILLILDMFMYFSNSLKHISNSVQVTKEIPNPEYEKLNKDLETKKNQILKILANYRYNDERLYYTLINFRNDVAAYKEILIEKDKKNERLNILKMQKEVLGNSLDEFFRKVNMPNMSYKMALEILKKELERYQSLKGFINSSNTKKRELETEIKDLKIIIENFFDKYLLSPFLPIENIFRDYENIIRLDEEITKKKTERENYLINNKLTTRPTETNYSLEELNDDYNQKLNSYNNLRQEIIDMEEKVSLLDDIKEILITKRERKKELENKAKLLDSLIDEIKNADQSLKDKYIAPIKDKFVEYAKYLEEAIGKNVSMDKDYKISFDQEGKLRSYEHLSSGMLTICALCFRLALIDNMFKEELPLIIMDDPFTNLDHNHLIKTKELLNKISSNKQILYFCCHESRKM